MSQNWKLSIKDIRELSGKSKTIRKIRKTWKFAKLKFYALKFNIRTSTQFWNITNLTIKNVSCISNINSNLYYYVKLITMLNWFLNKIFNDFQIRTKIHKISYCILLKVSGKSIMKFCLGIRESNEILEWGICDNSDNI